MYPLNHLYRLAPTLLLAWALPCSAGDRPDFLIGYTVQRTNLPGGQFPNRVTSRAFVVKADGTGARELGAELARKPNYSTSFAGWSPDGRHAILHQGWESPENGAWEHKNK